MCSRVSNWTLPESLGFQFLCSEKISQAKTEALPILDSKKSRISWAVVVLGMFENFSDNVGLSSTPISESWRFTDEGIVMKEIMQERKSFRVLVFAI